MRLVSVGQQPDGGQKGVLCLLGRACVRPNVSDGCGCVRTHGMCRQPKNALLGMDDAGAYVVLSWWIGAYCHD